MMRDWQPVSFEDEAPEPAKANRAAPAKTGRDEPASSPSIQSMPLALTMMLPPDVMKAVDKLTKAHTKTADQFEKTAQLLAEVATQISELQGQIVNAVNQMAEAQRNAAAQFADQFDAMNDLMNQAKGVADGQSSDGQPSLTE